MRIALFWTVYSISWLQKFTVGGTCGRSLTRLEYLPLKLPFTEARNVCHSMNMTLVEVKDKTKQLAVQEFWRMFRTRYTTKSFGLGLGLVKVPHDDDNFTWVESSEPLSWAYWSNVMPINATCVRMIYGTWEWSLASCDYGRAYICEQLSEPHMEPGTKHYALPGGQDWPTTYDLECEELCDSFLSAEGTTCWAFHTWSLIHRCSIFYIIDPYRVNNVSMYKDMYIDETSYTKQCFYAETEVSLKEESYTGQPKSSESLLAKQTISTSGYPEIHKPTSNPSYRTLTASSQQGFYERKTTTTERKSASTEIRQDVNTESTSPFSSGNLTQSTDTFSPITSGSYYDSTSGNKVLSTSMTNSQKWRSTLSELMLSSNVKGWNQPTPVSTRMNGTDMTDQPEKSSSIPTSAKTIDITVSSIRRSCYCPCYKKTQMNNQKFIDAVITSLSINKKNLSAERRKYYSVQDNRTLATGIGCTGVVILVLATSLVVCVDIFTLVEKLNGCRHH